MIISIQLKDGAGIARWSLIVGTYKEYFFAYPEDFGQSGVEWISDSLKTRARHPAFEIIFVYSEEEGSLDIYAPKNTKAVPELQKLFAKTILKLDTLQDGSIDQAYL